MATEIVGLGEKATATFYDDGDVRIEVEQKHVTLNSNELYVLFLLLKRRF
jgi:hypothetical protein